MSNEMMNVKELAAYLNLNEKRLYALVRQGRIPGTRITGKWTFPKQAIDAWMESQAWTAVEVDRRAGPEAEGKQDVGGLILAGSDDLLIQALLRRARAEWPGLLVSFANLGSLGGLRALREGTAHMAGCHLLDPETGTYNVPQVRRLLADLDPVIVTLAFRKQGFLLPADRPDWVRDFPDLTRKGLRFINRQKGSGTRLLLDHRLAEGRIAPSKIRGYASEVHTHLEVGMAVLAGEADVGLATEAVARALGLAFVPVLEERYDLVIPRRIFFDPSVLALVDTLRSPGFRVEVEGLGGYDGRESGRVVFSGDAPLEPAQDAAGDRVGGTGGAPAR